MILGEYEKFPEYKYNQITNDMVEGKSEIKSS